MFELPPNFWAIPKDYTFWRLLDSNFVAALLTAYVAILAAYITRAKEKVERAKEEVETDKEKIKDDIEDYDTIVTAMAELENREEELAADTVEATTGENWRGPARQFAANARAILRRKADSDSDGRRQRTYKKISGHRPAVLAIAMADRGVISEKAKNSAVDLFSIWRQYERGRAANRAVPRDVHDKMQEHLRTLESELNGFQ